LRIRPIEITHFVLYTLLLPPGKAPLSHKAVSTPDRACDNYLATLL
jgi:hypothetical protein